jgi:hypothetical protein
MTDRVRTKRPKPDDNGEADGTDFNFGANAPPPAAEPTQAEAAPAGDTPDRWSAEYQGLDQGWDTLMGGPTKPKIIKVEKPSKTRVFRVHPTMRLKTVLLALKEDNEVYLIDRPLRKVLPPSVKELCGEYTLLACVSKGGTPFFWPVRMADADGKWNVWHSSAWQIAQDAVGRWTRMYANRDAGHYGSDWDTRPPVEQQEPAWPEMTLDEWLRVAFQGHLIDSLEHPVIRRLLLED